jgi:hypothetical protein
MRAWTLRSLMENNSEQNEVENDYEDNQIF